MSLEQKTRSLLNELFVATGDEKVVWLPGTQGNSFRAALDSAQVILQKHSAEPGGLCDWDNFAFLLKDKKHRTIAEYIPSEKEKQNELRELWNLVSDRTQRPDEIIDRIMREIHSRRGVRPAE